MATLRVSLHSSYPERSLFGRHGCSKRRLLLVSSGKYNARICLCTIPSSCCQLSLLIQYQICYPRFTNRAHYWDPQTLTYRFLAEAKRLWELESGKPRITTIQAGLLFNVFYNLSGLDEVGQAYRLQAITLARDMHLFNSAAFEDQGPRVRHGMAYTAWTLFNWETYVVRRIIIHSLN